MKLLFASLIALVAATSAVEPRITAEHCGAGPEMKTVSSFIVGGESAKPNSWPFICSLQQSNSHICGGSLVKSKTGTYYFITAAHCVTHAARFYRINCGVHDRFGDTTHQQIIYVQTVKNHEQYNANTYSNDISVLVLSSQPKENTYVQGVCIASQDHFGGEISHVLGWGAISEGGSGSRVLRQVSKPILTDAECRGAYGSAYNDNTMLCSGLLGTGGKDACQGDSGGPLVVSRNSRYELVGVVSWGYGCARPEYPGVYADVWDLRNWINSKIN